VRNARKRGGSRSGMRIFHRPRPTTPSPDKSEQSERAHGSRPSRVARRCHLRTSLRNGAVHVRASSTNSWTGFAWILPLSRNQNPARIDMVHTLAPVNEASRCSRDGDAPIFFKSRTYYDSRVHRAISCALLTFCIAHRRKNESVHPQMNSRSVVCAGKLLYCRVSCIHTIQLRNTLPAPTLINCFFHSRC